MDQRKFNPEKFPGGENSENNPDSNGRGGEMDVYKLLKKRIERGRYQSKEEMQQMLDDYRYAGRITSEQYRELTDLLKAQ